MEGPVRTLVLCRCGRLMSDRVDLDGLASRAAAADPAGGVEVVTYACLGPDRDRLVARAGETPLRLGACSRSLHGPTFRRALEEAGRDPDAIDLVDVRGIGFANVDPLRARDLAWERLRPVGVAPAASAGEPPRVLVIGAGSAGWAATRALVEGGATVVLVDRGAEIGGLDGVEADGVSPGELAGVRWLPRRSVTRIRPVAGGYAADIAGQDPLDEIFSGVVLAVGTQDRSPGEMVPGLLAPTEVISRLEAPEASPGDLDDAGEGPEALATGTPSPAPTLAVVAGLADPSTRGTRVGPRTLVRALDLAADAVRVLGPGAVSLFWPPHDRAPVRARERLEHLVRRGGVTVIHGWVSSVQWVGDRYRVIAGDRILGRRVMVEAHHMTICPPQAPQDGLDELVGEVGLPVDADGFLVPPGPGASGVGTSRAGIFIASGHGALRSEDSLMRGWAAGRHALRRRVC